MPTKKLMKRIISKINSINIKNCLLLNFVCVPCAYLFRIHNTNKAKISKKFKTILDSPAMPLNEKSKIE